MPGEIRARVPEGSITGWLAGDGPPVLVLHGGPGLSDYTAPLAAELTDAFGVIRYQQRGLAPSVTSGPCGRPGDRRPAGSGPRRWPWRYGAKPGRADPAGAGGAG